MQMLQKNVYLLGFMGSGKTTIGKTLANVLNYSFIDLDLLIESKLQKTISEIFAEFGEMKFREMEKAALESTFSLENVVVATGGGTPCFFDNLAKINENGISVYLKMNLEILLGRLKSKIEKRPLLKNRNSNELRTYIENTLSEREIFYQKAHFTIVCNNLSIKNIKEEIKKAINF